MMMTIGKKAAKLPDGMAKSLKIELDYLAALAADSTVDARDLHIRLGFILGQLDAMLLLNCIEYDFYRVAVDEAYATFHGEPHYKFE